MRTYECNWWSLRSFEHWCGSLAKLGLAGLVAKLGLAVGLVLLAAGPVLFGLAGRRKELFIKVLTRTTLRVGGFL